MSDLLLQQRLLAKGFPVTTDGVAGPQTYGALFRYMGADTARAADLGEVAGTLWLSADITTPLRIAHFMAQAAHETQSFRYMRELWGPTDAQKGYEGRDDLGNVIPGDGHRFLGRGVFQCTGRDNYDRYGKRLKIDLCCNPERAEEPFVAMAIACLYWADHGLNLYADRDDVLAVSNGINRGNPASLRQPNGFPERKAQLAKAKAVLCA